MKNLSILCWVICIFFSCSDNKISEEVELAANDFRGVYKIASMTTNVALDLNNDEIQSNNYLEEISLPYKMHNGEIINFGFTPDRADFVTTARPYHQSDNKTKFLQIFLPEQKISPLYVGNDTFINISLEVRRLNLTLIYKLINGQVEIESKMFDFFKYGGVSNLKIVRITKDSFEITFDKQFYDFKDDVFKASDIRIVMVRR